MAFLLIPSTSPTGEVKPVTPLILISFNPPASELMTTVLAAMASSAASPKLSYSEGNKNTSLTAKISSICSCLPKKRTSASSPYCLVRSSARGRSGPSPTINNLEGSAA